MAVAVGAARRPGPARRWVLGGLRRAADQERGAPPGTKAEHPGRERKRQRHREQRQRCAGCSHRSAITRSCWIGKAYRYTPYEKSPARPKPCSPSRASSPAKRPDASRTPAGQRSSPAEPARPRPCRQRDGRRQRRSRHLVAVQEIHRPREEVRQHAGPKHGASQCRPIVPLPASTSASRRQGSAPPPPRTRRTPNAAATAARPPPSGRQPDVAQEFVPDGPERTVDCAGKRVVGEAPGTGGKSRCPIANCEFAQGRRGEADAPRHGERRNDASAEASAHRPDAGQMRQDALAEERAGRAALHPALGDEEPADDEEAIDGQFAERELPAGQHMQAVRCRWTHGSRGQLWERMTSTASAMRRASKLFRRSEREFAELLTGSSSGVSSD